MSSSKLNSKKLEADRQATGKETRGVDPMDEVVCEDSLLY